MIQDFIRLNSSDISSLEQRYRTTMMNSLAGARQAILVGSSNSAGQPNLAIFNSLIHIGANPPLQGLLFRPAEVERHTLENILDTDFYSLNFVPTDFIEEAHQTSARYPREVSEFDTCHFSPTYIDAYPCPLVESSPIQIILKRQRVIPLEINATQLLIGSVEEIFIQKNLLQSDGLVDSSEITALALGLDTYLKSFIEKRMAYAKPDLRPRKI